MTNHLFYGILFGLFEGRFMAEESIFRQINWVDIFVLILLVRGTYIGLRYGFITEIFKIFGIIVALFVSFRYYSNLAQFLATQVFFSKLSPSLQGGLSFIALILLTLAIFRLGHFVARSVMRLEASGLLERVGGVICGFIRGGVVAGLILFALNLLPVSYLKTSINENSWSGSRLIKVGPAIYYTIAKFSPGEKSE